jgi:hypothetical protein
MRKPFLRRSIPQMVSKVVVSKAMVLRKVTATKVVELLAKTFPRRPLFEVPEKEWKVMALGMALGITLEKAVAQRSAVWAPALAPFLHRLQVQVKASNTTMSATAWKVTVKKATARTAETSKKEAGLKERVLETVTANHRNWG